MRLGGKARISEGWFGPDARGMQRILQGSLLAVVAFVCVGGVSQAANRPAYILMPSLHRVGLGIATGSVNGAGDAVMATADFSS
jgi:hypothetical protein